MSAVEVRRTGGVAEIACRFPHQRLDESAAQALAAAVEELKLDEEVSVVVVRSRGADFCLGADGDAPLAALACIAAVGALPQPVIAEVKGRAWAEGCELALACDLRLAGEGSSFCLPQIARGSLPRHGATQRLPRLIGAARALDLLWSGRVVGAAEAERIGLASRRVKRAGLRRLTTELGRELAAKGPIALRLAKEAVHKAADLTLEQGIRLEQDLYVLLQTTADRAEGIQAFRQKRAPRFSGK